jgi:hypothetical protein
MLFPNQNLPTHNLQTLMSGGKPSILVSVANGPKYTPPDMNHKVDETICRGFNSKLMRAIINKKMRKNPSYMEFMADKIPRARMDLIPKG